MRYIFFFLSLTFLQSCTKDFEEINTNPNAPIEVQPELLLRQVIYNYGEHMAYEGFVAGNLLGQYFTAVDFNLFDRHSLAEPQFGGNPWPVIYQNLRDNEIILDLARANQNFRVYEGPALILKAYMTAALTDIFGDIPYREALNGKEGSITPSYDSQADIYLGESGILNNLRIGIQKIENYNGVATLGGDVLFNGDLDNWIRFANSLLIKHLMRVSEQIVVNDELAAIYNSGQYIQNQDQNATFDFTDGAPNNFRLATARIGDFNIYIMSETMEEILTKLDDPRASVFFRPASGSGEFNGFINGFDASSTSITLADYSLSGEVFRERTGDLDANFITSWETKFFLAEAALKGIITADAKNLYEEGVAEAFAYWQTTLPVDYLNSEVISFENSDADALEKIATQKWLANITNGFEGWIDYRRTGFPKLKTVAASLNNNLIPERMPYPIDEAALNATAYDAAAANTDGNSINAPVWWAR